MCAFRHPDQTLRLRPSVWPGCLQAHSWYIVCRPTTSSGRHYEVTFNALRHRALWGFDDQLHGTYPDCWLDNPKQAIIICNIGRGGGGGGRSLSIIKNTPKAVISGPKNTLIYKNRWPFAVKTPLISSNHWHWMNAYTNFNFRFYNPRACLAVADSEAQSLRESLGVRAADISWIVRGFLLLIFRTWVPKITLLLQIADMRRS